MREKNEPGGLVRQAMGKKWRPERRTVLKGSRWYLELWYYLGVATAKRHMNKNIPNGAPPSLLFAFCSISPLHCLTMVDRQIRRDMGQKTPIFSFNGKIWA